jgi:hypothetical protein
MRFFVGIGLALVLVWPGPSAGQNSPEYRGALAGIRGLVLYVDTLSTEMPQKGITRDVLRLKLGKQLRDAGIPVVEAPLRDRIPGDPVLVLAVTAIFDERNRRCVCSLRMDLTQTVRLDRNPGYVVFGVPTWSIGRLGLYTKHWREEMIEDVYSLADEFIDAYYGANPYGGE